MGTDQASGKKDEAGLKRVKLNIDTGYGKSRTVNVAYGTGQRRRGHPIPG